MRDMVTFENFTKQYQVSKTLRFELIPQGKTLDNIEKRGIISEDKQRNEDYQEAKKILDKIYKYILDSTMSGITIDWSQLWEATEEFRKTKDRKKYESAQAKVREQLFKYFKKREVNKKNKPKSLDKAILDSNIITGEVLAAFPEIVLTCEEMKILNKFKGFTSYFDGFFDNRENIFTDKGISTSFTYRLVNDNFIKFFDNCQIYRKLSDEIPELQQKFEEVLKNLNLFPQYSLEQIFDKSFYNNLLTQVGIDSFNQILGGISGEEGSIKKQGLNEVLNLVMQKNKDARTKIKYKAHKFMPLFKQILNERSTFSFIPKSFENEGKVLATLAEYRQYLSKISVDKHVHDLIESMETYSPKDLWIDEKNIFKLSQILFGSWNKIRDGVQDYKVSLLQKENETALKQIRKEIKAGVTFQEILLGLPEENLYENINCQVDSLVKNYNNALFVLLPEKIETDRDKIRIKEIIDPILDLYHFLEIFQHSSTEKLSTTFEEQLIEILKGMGEIVPLYNKIRNFATRKSYSEEKFKLNFGESTLAKGWDINKIKDYKSILLIKNREYFIGILNGRFDIDRTQSIDDRNSSYKFMKYKQFDLVKQLPKISFCKEVRAYFQSGKSEPYQLYTKAFLKPLTITKEILDLYDTNYAEQLGESGEIKQFHKAYLDLTGDKFGYKKALIQYIDFIKVFIKSYRRMTEFGEIKLLPSEKYNSIDEVYSKLNQTSYDITFEKVDEGYIDLLVDEGRLYLFKLHNKDFSAGSIGKPNLHTLYWKALFEEENLSDVVVKLNGQAELFYRPKSLTRPVVHEEGEVIINKTTSTGLPVPDDVYVELSKFVRNGKKGNLTDKAKNWLDKVTVRKTPHAITKDRRFTVDKFFFHVPITLNYKSPSKLKSKEFNNLVRRYIKENSNINIIGIDRGERNLIYTVVIDGQGNIIEQRSFNTVGTYNYQEKLEQKEKERQTARQNWATITKMKDLKQGYLSAVVHELSKMIVKYKAIVVLENLNVGFKRMRGGIAERSVYQQFEKALIDKLNYLVFKDEEQSGYGGVLNAYQLTGKFESFSKMDQQTGFLFYVPAAYTSKIDPLTGFITPFSWKHVKNREDRRNFLNLFSKLYYDVNTHDFVLAYHHSNKESKYTIKGNWGIADWDILIQENKEVLGKTGTPYCVGKRIVYMDDSATGHNRMCAYYPHTELKKLLSEYGIEYTLGQNLLKTIQELDDDKLVKGLFYIIKAALQMRNSNSETGEDYISSPIEGRPGICFDSRAEDDTLPHDADANGAFHIAMKGLLLTERIRNDDKLAISNEEWLNYIQEMRG